MNSQSIHLLDIEKICVYMCGGGGGRNVCACDMNILRNSQEFSGILNIMHVTF